MKRTLPAWTGLAAVVLVLTWLFGAPTAASAQHVREGGSGGGGGTAVSRPAPSPAPASSPAPSSGGSSSGGSSSGGSSSGSGSSSGGSGSSRGGSHARGGAARGSDAGGRAADSGDAGTPRRGRSPEGQPKVGEAVPRTTPPPTHDGGNVISNGYGGFYPWGAIGYGAYYGGFYDPYDPWYGAYPTYYPSNVTYGDEGSLRLKVKPREASVYVDGYYTGVVDDYDGIFQKLQLQAGAHRIELRAPGYEPLTFDVDIQPEHKTTYRGEMVKQP